MAQVWKIAPGEHAVEWDMCRERHCIVLGWRALHDYKRFGNDRSAVARVLGGGPGNGFGAAGSVLRFAYEVKPADVVVANRGRTAVVGIGVVNSGYLRPSSRTNPSRSEEYPHARGVDWIIDRFIDLGTTFFAPSAVTRLGHTRVNRICHAYVKKYPESKQVLDELFGRSLVDDQGSIETGEILKAANEKLEQSGAFDPANVRDARTRTLSLIVQRQGQSAFRKRLLTAYDRRCAITGCPVEEILEAAHIVPYKGHDTDRSDNGMLLRADLHTLFDLHLIAIDELTMRVLVSSKLNGSDYARYRGTRIRIPRQPGSQPSVGALKGHRLLYERGGQTQ